MHPYQNYPRFPYTLSDQNCSNTVSGSTFTQIPHCNNKSEIPASTNIALFKIIIWFCLNPSMGNNPKIKYCQLMSLRFRPKKKKKEKFLLDSRLRALPTRPAVLLQSLQSKVLNVSELAGLTVARCGLASGTMSARIAQVGAKQPGSGHFGPVL